MRHLSLLLVGDLILDEPSPDSFFDLSRSVLGSADVLVGHVEVPHTTRGEEHAFDIPAPPSNPEHLYALGRAGFHAATLAGNHIADAGPFGIEDTIYHLFAQGIVTTGAGANLDAARKPALVERNGVRFGILSINCVGPKESWAGANKHGCAYLEVITHYELGHATPGGPPKHIYTFAEPLSLRRMQADIERLRSSVDVLIVALHKGLGHSPATLAMYERPVAQAAVDAGADVVVGHHGHILQGIEIYKGKPIFHGLGNFVTVTRALNVEDNASPERLDWARKRRKLFGFEPDPNYPTFPFHPEAKNAMIATCAIDPESHTIRAGFIPCWIHPSGQPEALGRGALGEQVAAYIEHISKECKLPATFHWHGDAVWVE